MTRFLFVIDTDSYSGNFNREMCAYLTSQWDQATHGGKQAAIAEKEIPKDVLAYFNEHMIECHEAVDDGHSDVCQIIYPTPGYWSTGHGREAKGKPPKGVRAYPAYQSVAIFFDEEPPKNITNFMIKRAQKYCAERLNIIDEPEPIEFLGVRILKESTETKIVEQFAWSEKDYR